MVVAGPNGCGKSTLLNHIRTADGGERIVYVGPHRSIRRQRVMERHLFAQPILLEELLARTDTPGYEGIQLLGGARDPWGYDDSGNYLKHALCQVEIERQQAIARRYDRDGQIQAGVLVDPWQPLKDFTTSLLPHLQFHAIDTSNRDQVRCLWKTHSQEVLVDLDDLSSGEKSVIQMFYPIVERRIRVLLSEMQGTPAGPERGEICVLIDEPELHLHPNLQMKVLDYLRVLTSGEGAQVIVATHSPTIVEYSGFDELFLLRPAELLADGDNQLIPLADNEERLRALRDLFGGTSNLTALQPIVVVEGAKETDGQRSVPDRKLYRALHARFDTVTLLPGGGKAQCMALLDALADALGTFSAQLRAVALLDRDVDPGAAPPRVHYLPVSMIENFLLDPDSIWEVTRTLATPPFGSVDDVTAALDALLDEREGDEVERRTVRALGTAFFRPSAPLEDISGAAEAFARDVTTRFRAEGVAEARVRAQERVAALRDQHRRREQFHGKDAIGAFYARHVAPARLARAEFTFDTATHARRRRAVTEFFNAFFADALPVLATPVTVRQAV
jgi:ABC-type hemin transport system ATPase subunit